MKKRTRILVFLLTTYHLPLTTVFAVEVEPVRLELTIPVDQPTLENLQITNRGSKATQIRLSADRYRSFDPALNPPSAQSWLDFEPNQFTLAPSATSTVLVRITPPDHVARDSAGEYLAAILVDELPLGEEGIEEKEGKEAQAKITLVPRFAMPVYLKIEGRERIDVEIAQVSIQASDSSKPLLQVKTTLLNRGSVHIRPTGTIGLFAAQGGMSQAHPLGQSVPLLPGGSVSLPTVVPMPPPGQYKAVVTVGGESGKLLQKEIPFEVTSEGEILS